MNRKESIQQLTNTSQWDIIIIGGGATGLGAAIDAACRGYKTLLLEQYDFAKATSSRSTKLVHGGVRYLQQGNIKLIKEALKERGLLLKNAPHVCAPLQFVIPVYSWWRKLYYAVGLKLYDLIAGKYSLGKTTVVSAATVKEYLPTIDETKLAGGVVYFDGQFDDARLAINMAQTATEKGATLINYCEVIDFIKSENKIDGVVFKDTIHQQQHTAKAKVIINATGVFADKILNKLSAIHEPIVSVSQGVHIVIDKKYFPDRRALMIPKTTDGRVLFAVPWHHRVVVGTTDTPVDKASIEPVALKQEIDFIIHNVNQYLKVDISEKDVLSVFTGLRPLVHQKAAKTTAVLPRDHTILIDERGVVTITGGKWTTYRKMAQEVVDKAMELAVLPATGSSTETVQLHGYRNRGSLHQHHHLCCYGADAEEVENLVNENAQWGERICPGYLFIKAQVIWAIRQEMAMTVEDFLARRIRLLFLDAKAAIAAAPVVAIVMAKEMNQDEAWVNEQVETFTKLAQGYLVEKYE
jgi:glycerol-3-phosphate dehydrogenase